MTNSNQGMSKKLAVLGAVIVLGGVVFVGWFLSWFLADLSKELLITLTTAVLTIMGTLWINRNTKLKDRELQIQAQQAEKREKVVGNFMKNFWLLTQDDFKNEKIKQNHLRETISDIMINGSMWLSDSTLKKFVEFRLGAQTGTKVDETALYIARLMLAFREDLGHNNKGLTEKDMLDIFINDTDKLFNSSTKS